MPLPLSHARCGSRCSAQELLVFSGPSTPDAAVSMLDVGAVVGMLHVGAVVGMLHVEPHTTLRELRQKLQAELGFRLKQDEVLALSRGTFDETSRGTFDETSRGTFDETSDGGSSGSSGDGNGNGEALLKTALKAELVPLPSTQNHKLVYPLFPRKEHVLVVEVQQQLPSDCVRQAVVSRALKGEKVLHVDLSKGGEPIPIPVFNGADDDTSGMDFT